MRSRITVRIVAAVAALATLSALLAQPAAATEPDVDPSLSVETWASDIVVPWEVAFLPDGEALIPEKTTGIVHRRHTNGTITELDMRHQNDFTAPGEGGLMGLAIDPDFDRNGRFYTCQNSTRSDVRVIRWKLNGARTVADRQRVIIDDIPMTTGRHSGCRLRFGFEGHLWVATGDAATSEAPQSLSSLGGKVLRVDPRTGNGISSNPFYTTARADRSKIYTYGHRNPQGLDRRPCTNQMWNAEHGPGTDDEINLLSRGGNYGWDPGPGYNELVPMTDTSLPGPQKRAKWSSDSPTIALSGVGWIRGADWGAWDGELAGGTLKNTELWIFEFANNNRLLDTDVPAETDGIARMRTAVLGPDGSLYVPDSNNSRVLRVTPAPGVAPGSQDLDGDGFDDLLVGAPGEDVGRKRNAGSTNVLHGGSGGLIPSSNGAPSVTQKQVNGASNNGGDLFGSAFAYGDIDADGITDVVVGTPGEDVSGRNGAGAITVVCGRTNGVQKRSSQTFSQSGSVAGSNQSGDAFGTAVAMGDFDGDGYDDVITGAPGEDVGGASNAGAVTVLYGTSAGLTTEHSRAFTQAGKVGGSVQAGDRFGSALAVGDFDDDGYDDVAVGVPGENVNGQADAGAVVIIFGTRKGLKGRNSQYLTQAGAVPSDNGADDHFGEVLASGDFNNDGHDDLAIGSPREDHNGTDAGAVVVLFGTDSGLSAAGTQYTQSGSLPGTSAAGDNTGSALAAADFDGDGDDDLAIGSPGENGDRGAITILSGSPSGLGGAVAHDASALPGPADAGDRLGAALRSGDFNGDGRQDLVVGTPGDDVAGQNNAGSIIMLFGSGSGITTSGASLINSNSSGVAGSAEAGDRWGEGL